MSLGSSSGHVRVWPATSGARSSQTAPYTLPAGDYRLYLLNDNPTGTLTLELPGLPGEAHVEPQFATRQTIRELERESDDGAGGTITFRDGVDLASRGWLTVELIATAGNETMSQRVEVCSFAPGADDSGANAYHQGCPGGASDAGTNTGWVGASGVWKPWFAAYEWDEMDAAPGHWGLGGNVENVPAGSAQGRVGWLPYDGTPILGARAPEVTGYSVTQAPPATAASAHPESPPRTAAARRAAARRAALRRCARKHTSRARRRCRAAVRRRYGA
jgi:hypothetical protein